MAKEKEIVQVQSPCKTPPPYRNDSPDRGSACNRISSSVTPADLTFSSQDSGAILNLLEKHLDPMLHEASIRNIVYSPDTSSSTLASPVFVLSSVASNQAPEMVANQSVAADFLDNLSTPMQQPLLKMPKTKKRRPCLNKVTFSPQRHSVHLASKARRNSKLETIAQEILSNNFGLLDVGKPFDDRIKKLYLQQYKKPLSPAAMKTISALVEKGGCKAIRLNGKGKGKVAPAPATTQT